MAIFGILSFIISVKYSKPITSFRENRDRRSEIYRSFISFLPTRKRRIKSRKSNKYLKCFIDANVIKVSIAYEKVLKEI